MCPLQIENNVLSALKSDNERYLKSSLGQREKYVLVKLYNLICSNQLLLQFINFNKFSTATNIWFSSPCLFRNDDIAYEETLQIRACNLVGNSNFSVSWYTISKHKAQDIEEHSKVCFQTDSVTRHLTKFSTLFWSLSSDSEACPELLRHESAKQENVYVFQMGESEFSESKERVSTWRKSSWTTLGPFLRKLCLTQHMILSKESNSP